jgi:hypothetical protein
MASKTDKRLKGKLNSVTCVEFFGLHVTPNIAVSKSLERKCYCEYSHINGTSSSFNAGPGGRAI